MAPENLKYTEQHEWIRVEGDTGVVGITDHAQESLGDITFVELPIEGADLKKGDEACAIESCKAAASIYAVVSGKIVGGNEQVEDDPALVNNDPFGDGWVYKIQLSDPSELDALMDSAKYEEFLKSEE